MTDNLTPENRLKTMRAVKGRDTKLEKQLAQIVRNLGIRGGRRNVQKILGKPDLVLKRMGVVIFVDGCFWHGCPRCKRALPKTNRTYWSEKIKRNNLRDKAYTRALRKDGWKVIRIWEHELKTVEGQEKVSAKLQKRLHDSSL